MSLNAEERLRTSAELRENLVLSELSEARVAADLGIAVDELDALLAVDGDPREVWRLRDYLESAVVASGREPVALSVLTESARGAARRWFGEWSEPGRE